MARPKAPVSRFVVPPFGYAGNKSRLLHHLLPVFGDLTRHTFIDVCAGSGCVGVNVDAAEVWLNDVSGTAMGLLSLLADSRPGQVEAEVTALAASYGLSDTYTHGYAAYGGDSSRGVAAWNRAGFLRLRADVNAGKYAGRERLVAEFTLVLFGFNNYQLFSPVDGRWVTPVGKRDFNGSMREKTARTVARLRQIKHRITTLDFRDVNPADVTSPFLYADPPYLLGEAPYSAGWRESDDLALFSYLDAANRAGIPFVLSNVSTHKGRQHDQLIRWSAKYRVRHLDFDYRNASHKAAGVGVTQEVLVTNL